MCHETVNMLVSSEELDRLLMPPPSRPYIAGNTEMKQAHLKGLIKLSLPTHLLTEDNNNTTHKSGQNGSDQSVVVTHLQAVYESTQEPHLCSDSDSGSSSSDIDSHDWKEIQRVNSQSQKRRLFIDHVENCKFSDIIGHGEAKIRIEEILLTMTLPPSLIKKVLVGVRAMPASILLYGPPGCGKTQLARAIAGEGSAAFVPVLPSDVLSKFVGESEAAVRDVFRTAVQYAEQLDSKCAVVFFDEIDALGQNRNDLTAGDGAGCSRRVLAELLTQLTQLADHQKSGAFVDVLCDPDDKMTTATSVVSQVRILVVAATNRPEDCDPALLRRFGIRLKVDLPSKRDRRRMFVRHLQSIDHTISRCELDDLAESTSDFSGSDIENLARDAVMAPIRECIRGAALTKRRLIATKSCQSAGDSLCQTDEKMPQVDPSVHARNSFLELMHNLRPVTIDDFDKAIQLWLNRRDTSNQMQGPNSKKCKQGLYYTSASSDEDEDNE